MRVESNAVDNGETAVCPHCNVDSVVPYKENNFKALLSTLRIIACIR